MKVEEAAVGKAAAVEQKGDVKHIDITNSNTSYTTPKAPPCRFFMKIGKCRFGEKCKFTSYTTNKQTRKEKGFP
eukprot:12900585-Prorocentrum_lima.AAC.1